MSRLQNGFISTVISSHFEKIIALIKNRKAMSKAEELYQTFYNLIEHKLNEKYSKYEKDVVNELVNIAEKFVDEQNKTIEKTSYLMGFVDGKSQNKMPSDEEIKKLEHHKDYTCGLWATDRPDLINDPKKLLFEIKY